MTALTNPCKTCKYRHLQVCCNGSDMPMPEWSGTCMHYEKDKQSTLINYPGH
jgi:hypothetical protein